MKKTFRLLLVLSLLCLTFACTPYQRKAGGSAAAGVSKSALDRPNPWRGGVIGGATEAVVGATLAEVSARASREAVRTGKPVEYSTDSGRVVYRADPAGYDRHTGCRKARERVWENNRLMTDESRRICDGEKRERE